MRRGSWESYQGGSPLLPSPPKGALEPQAMKRSEGFLQRQDTLCSRGDLESRISDKIFTSRTLVKEHEPDLLAFSPGFVTRLGHFRQDI